jgi:glycosyltransferase involved in cell wall biosynthesis
MSYAYDIARELQQAGYLKRLITAYHRRPQHGLDYPHRVRRILLSELTGQALYRLLRGANSFYIANLIRDNLYDLLARRHVDGGDVLHAFNHYALFSMRKAIRLGMKTVVERDTAHPVYQQALLSEEYARYGLNYSSLNRLILRKHVQEYAEADAILVPSEFVWRTMVEQGVPESKLRLAPLGFDPARFRPLPEAKTDSAFRVLFVGSVSLQKGVQYLLEAFKRLALPNAELVFVGGAFPDSQTFLPQYEGLYRHIWFVPQERLVELYNSASVFVLPSLQDGFGMVVCEAAACGLPVIISENVGARIRDGRDGYIVPIRDPDALADRLLCLYRDERLRREMGESARQYVQQFTWKANLHQLVEIYRGLLKGE